MVRGMVLQMKDQASSLNEGKEIILRALTSGKALEKFQTMLVYQGVESVTAANLCHGQMWRILSRVPSSRRTPIQATSSVCWKLGAGRSKPGQAIDHRVGIEIFKRVGESVTQGTCIMEVNHPTEILDMEIYQQLENAIKIGKHKKSFTSLIIEIITE
ncbi:Pyrimidine-nucleoside phosphorylase [Blattella germanica]|nr:Pyrimidine-nucleoside phosphorylase [Blattella germanica]